MPGTLCDYGDECKMTTTTAIMTATTAHTVVVTTTSTIKSTSSQALNSPLNFEIGSTLFSVLIALSGCITFSILMVCVVIAFHAVRKRQSHTITPQENIYTVDQLEQQQQQHQGYMHVIIDNILYTHIHCNK